MEKGFHYYCPGILARVSGFGPEEALTIAYASRYVGECTESEPIKVGDMIFDPVPTSHYALMPRERVLFRRKIDDIDVVPILDRSMLDEGPCLPVGRKGGTILNI